MLSYKNAILKDVRVLIVASLSFLFLFLGGCASHDYSRHSYQSSQAYQSQPDKKSLPNDTTKAFSSLLDIFDRAEILGTKGASSDVYDVSVPVYQYFSACCLSKAAATQKVENSGFKISGELVDAFKGYNAKYDYRKQGYDSVISGKIQRPLSIPLFYREYQLTLFMRDNKVIRIAAYAFNDAL